MDQRPPQTSSGRKSEEVRRSESRSRSAAADPSRVTPTVTGNLRRYDTNTEENEGLGRPSPDRASANTSRGPFSSPPQDDNMKDESFSFPTTRSYSWESQSDSDDRGGSAGGRSSATRRDQRKFDMTTPTLIDEYDDMEEEEMISLQQRANRFRQDEQQRSAGLVIKDDSTSLRRTPGASMYQSVMPEDPMYNAASLRRTPGPPETYNRPVRAGSSTSSSGMPHQHQQHQHQHQPHYQEQGDESSVLGFGLTLSTPVASSNRAHREGTDTWERTSSVSSQSTPPRNNQSTADNQGSIHASSQQHQLAQRPPRGPGTTAGRAASDTLQGQSQTQPQRGQQQFTFTPWTLANKGAPSQFDNRYGACSPNTMRLTEDLGNLLWDEEDSQESQQIFRGPAATTTTTTGQPQQQADSGVQGEPTAGSWASSYIFKTEPGEDIRSRVPRSSTGRGRRGRYDSTSRRSRGNTSRHTDDRGGTQQQIPSFLPYAQQPKPVRNTQVPPLSTVNPFFSGGFDVSTSGSYNPSNISSDQQQQQQQQDQQQSQPPRFFNFGGAFAPPAREGGFSFRPPAPAQAGVQGTGGGGSFFPTQPQIQFPRGSPPVFGDSRQSSGVSAGGGSSFQSHSFQPLPPMAASSRDSPFQHHFHSPTPGFADAAGSPVPFGFPPPNPYFHHPPPGLPTPAHIQHPAARQASATAETPSPKDSHRPVASQPTAQSQPQTTKPMQATASEFIPMAAQNETRPPLPQFPPPPHGWPGAHQPHFSPTLPQRNRPGTSTSWTSGEFVYAVPVPPQPHLPTEMPAGPPPSPSQASATRSEQPSEKVPRASPSAVVASPSPQQHEASHHAVAPSPSPVSIASGPSSQTQQQARSKSSRKSQGKRAPKSSKISEKDKKPEAATSSSGSAASANPRKSIPVNTAGTATGGGASGTIVKKKKSGSSKGRDSQTPEISGPPSARSTPTRSGAPTPASEPPHGEEGNLSASEDQTESKRSELIESPATRSAFKDFYRRFRSEERTSFQGAEDFAIQSLGDGSLPGKVHWRVYLELADLAKRSNRFADARRLYQQVCQLQPYASQGWLEYSKLEEECGHLNRGARILRAGLEYCEYSENLLTRAIKHEEKMGNLGRARELLARLKHIGIEKVWRTVLEGALLESRAGNVVMARRVLKYLMHHVPWYGPLYLEAYRLERDLGRTAEALQVVERGLAAIPRYGPLWFGAFRLCEEIDIAEKDYHLPRTMAMIDRATLSISKELIWKVHLDAAQMLERATLDQRLESANPLSNDESLYPASTLANCRNRFAMTILNCPTNLRWKVWLAAGRLELAIGNTDKARRLFLRAHQVVPEKGRATTLLECARLEEFTGDFDLARAILCRSRVEYGTDWKVWLESVLLEIRSGEHTRAIELAKGALEMHPGTGRLWAALVQLRFFEGGEEAQFVSLRQALNAVPKSGEVWCEGGRIHLNPFSRTFNLERARRHLTFATKFTPQYGDSFLESLRLELLEQWIAPMADLIWGTSKSVVLDGEEANFHNQLHDYLLRLFLGLVAVCSENFEREEAETETRLTEVIGSTVLLQILERLDTTYRVSSVNLSDLELRCANADPNYGLLWFHCRHGPTDTARRILTRATDKVVTELRKFVPIYIVALVRYAALTGTMGTEKDSDDDVAWENHVDEILLAAPSLHDILKDDDDKLKLKQDVEKNQEEGVLFLESSIAGTTFSTGLVELNRNQPIGELSLSERRKALFGTDALFS